METLDIDYPDLSQNEDIYISTEEGTSEFEKGEKVEEESEMTEYRKGELFVVSNVEKMRDVIDEYCKRTSSHFVVQKKSKNFGLSSLECDLVGHRVQWHDVRHMNSMIDNIVQFDGIPHISVGHYQLNCQFGVDAKASRRRKKQKLKEEAETPGKSRMLKNPTKKCGCPATINVKQIIKFPDFKILKNTEKRKRTGAAKLKEKLKTCRKELKSELLIIGRLPDICEHKYHELMEGREYSKEVIHPDIILKAKDFYLERKSNYEILEGIRDYLVNDMFFNQPLPHPNRRRFFPNLKDIRNINSRVRHLCRFTVKEELDLRNVIHTIKENGANVLLKIDENKSQDGARGTSSGDESIESDVNQNAKVKKEEKKEQAFIFCHQTRLQQRLMRRYGHEVTCLVEFKKFNNSKHVLTYQMYGLVVQTNVDFQVAGIMCCSKRRKDGLLECLEIFRDWNSSWIPRYFIVDCCPSIYNAVAVNFPAANYFLTPHSCEEEWLDFVQRVSNNVVEYADEIIAYMRNMQCSLTEESLTLAAAFLEESLVWQSNAKLRQWFQLKWLHNAKRWVFGYRPEDLLFTQHLKSTLSECIHPYREAIGLSAKPDGLVELIRNIAFDISDISYNRYVEKNRENYSQYLRYENTNDLSQHLSGVPTLIIPYVDSICKLAERNEFLISHDECGVFTVQVPGVSESQHGQSSMAETDDARALVKSITECTHHGPTKPSINDREVEIIETEFGSIEYSTKVEAGSYNVSFGDIHSYPFCTCSHWLLYRLPCVHMFAVFCRVLGWNFNMLSPLYRFNAVFDIDLSCIDTDFNKVLSYDKDCQVDSPFAPRCYCLEEQIFEHPVNVTSLLAVEAKEFLKHMESMKFIFKNRNLHCILRKQLGELVDSINAEVGNKRSFEVAEDRAGVKDEKVVPNSQKNVKLLGNVEKIPLSNRQESFTSPQSQVQPFEKKVKARMLVGSDVLNIEVASRGELEPMMKNYFQGQSGNSITPALLAEELELSSQLKHNAYKSLSERKRPANSMSGKVPLKYISPYSGICEKPITSKIIPAVNSDEDLSPSFTIPSDISSSVKSDVDFDVESDNNSFGRYVDKIGGDPMICKSSETVIK